MTVHIIVDDSSLLKHKKMLHMKVIEYMSLSNITVTYKYICTLLYNYAVTQHKHIIFAQKCHIRICTYFVHWKTYHMKQHTMSFSKCLQKVCNIWIWCYLWYHPHIHVIITTQRFYKQYLCRCKHIPNNRPWTMSPLLCTAMWMCTDGHYDDSIKG